MLDAAPIRTTVCIQIVMPTNKKIKGKSKPKTRKTIHPEVPSTTEDLVRAAERAMLTQDPERAIELFTKASLSAVNEPIQQAAVLEHLANAKLSVSDHDGALMDYQQGLTVLSDSLAFDTRDPSHLEQKAGLHLYIGQLLSGKDALQQYQAGIELLRMTVKLRQEHADSVDSSSVSLDEANLSSQLLLESRRKLSSAYCNAADLFLTDLCLEETAEQECQAYIDMALDIRDVNNEPSVDALQTAASFRLSQDRGLEAVVYIMKVYERMRVGCESVSKLLGLWSTDSADTNETEESRELTDIEEAQTLPEYEFRVQTSKLLLESSGILKKMEKETHRAEDCAKAAVNVLGSLMAENDEVVEVCYLMAEAFAFLGRTVPALHFYERAREMLTSIQHSVEDELANEEGDGDELQQQLNQVVCQLEECTSKIEELDEQLEAADAMEE